MRTYVGEEHYDALLRLKDRLEGQRTQNAQQKQTLARVAAALQRWKDGRLGVCARCFKVIPKARLLMQPYSEKCPDCERAPALAA